LLLNICELITSGRKGWFIFALDQFGNYLHVYILSSKLFEMKILRSAFILITLYITSSSTPSERYLF